MKAFEIVYGVITAAIVIALLTYYCLRNKDSIGPKGKDSVGAGIWWLSTFILCVVFTAVYQAGQIPNPYNASDVLSIIAGSVGNGFRIFTFDYSKQGQIISSVWQDGASGKVYGIAVFIVFLSAGLWTYYVLVTSFFRGILNEFRIIRNRLGGFFKPNTVHYIIVGTDQQAEKLLENYYKTKKVGLFKNDVTVLTGKISKTSSASSKYKKYLFDEGYTVLCDEITFRSLKKAGITQNNRRTVVIAISESDEQNLRVAEIMTKYIAEELRKRSGLTDEEAKAIIQGKNEAERKALLEKIAEIKLEGRIMYSFIERTEHFLFAENSFGKINFFNPSETIAEQFFFDHPITHDIADLIDSEKARLIGEYGEDGIIRKPNKEGDSDERYKIRNVFIGFGYVNYFMLKESVTNNQILGADYYADIYTNDIMPFRPSPMQVRFQHQASGLFGKKESIKNAEYFEDPKEKFNIVFHNADATSEEFYMDLCKQLKDSDFISVYIAMGNDKTNVETALEIRRVLAANYFDPKKIKIYANVIKNEASVSYDILNVNSIPIRIECFGLEKSVLDMDDIADSPINAHADEVCNQTHNIPWEFLPEFEKNSNRSKLFSLKNMLGFLGFDIVPRDSDEPSAVEEYTERYGLNDEKVKAILAKNPEKEKSARLEYLQRENGKVADNARNNLARLEHLRWDTFYLVNGWTKKPKRIFDEKTGKEMEIGREYKRKDLLLKQHACITTFEGLAELRRWQRDVVIAANKRGEGDKNATEPKEEDFDTIFYDFDLMDHLVERLEERSDWKIVRRE